MFSGILIASASPAICFRLGKLRRWLIDVTFSAHGRRVAEKFCNRANRRLHIRIRLFLSFELALRAECDRCQHRAGPRPEIFCREIFVVISRK